MTDGLPPPPPPIPPPDRHQIERLNALYDLSAPGSRDGWRAKVADRLRGVLARILFRQQEFNAALVDHINRNAMVGIEAHHASVGALAWVQERLDVQLDEMRRHHEALAAWERRSHAAVASLTASQEELRTAIGALQHTIQGLKRESARASAAAPASSEGGGQPFPASPLPQAAASHGPLDSEAYVGFEDRFRGSSEDIRERLSSYVPIFDDAEDVLDVGCGRGEFLALLRDRGIRSRGIDVNGAMVDVCRRQGLDADQADALAYLRARPDASLGGLFAAQVVEHLEPGYLTSLLAAAFQKLRPGAPIVLETINPACWFAFFESFIRDITHVRALHPDTLKYLMIASGFLHVDIQYRSPYPEHEKLQPVSPNPALGDWRDVINGNVERLNGLLFTCLDYAATGRRP